MFTETLLLSVFVDLLIHLLSLPQELTLLVGCILEISHQISNLGQLPLCGLAV